MKHTYIRVVILMLLTIELLGCATAPTPPPLRGCEVTIRRINLPPPRSKAPAHAVAMPRVQP